MCVLVRESLSHTNVECRLAHVLPPPVSVRVWFAPWSGKWVLLDGDRIAALCADFLHTELRKLGWEKVSLSLHPRHRRDLRVAPLPLGDQSSRCVDSRSRVLKSAGRCSCAHVCICVYMCVWHKQHITRLWPGSVADGPQEYILAVETSREYCYLLLLYQHTAHWRPQQTEIFDITLCVCGCLM